MKILVINGSPRKEARNKGVADLAKEILRNKGIEVLSFDVREQELPVFRAEGEQFALPNVQDLQAVFHEADGFFVATPEYHNAISGALKNMFDFVNAELVKDKPLAMAVGSGGGKGGINALNNLRLVGRGLYANVLPSQLIIDPYAFNENMQVVDEEVKLQVEKLVDELLLYALHYENTLKNK